MKVDYWNCSTLSAADVGPSITVEAMEGSNDNCHLKRHQDQGQHDFGHSAKRPRYDVPSTSNIYDGNCSISNNDTDVMMMMMTQTTTQEEGAASDAAVVFMIEDDLDQSSPKIFSRQTSELLSRSSSTSTAMCDIVDSTDADCWNGSDNYWYHPF